LGAGNWELEIRTGNSKQFGRLREKISGSEGIKNTKFDSIFPPQFPMDFRWKLGAGNSKQFGRVFYTRKK
jgi:hypothetical protein